jgi:poly-gamma-glutamate capsule biosynthesis protein CapA/YwtB (metallophosphatase superfamily)
MCGDVMTGRGIDQVLPHPGDPTIHESYMKNAGGYVYLAEQANGPIPPRVDDAYIWGFALEELQRRAPHVRIINLETSVTRSHEYWPGKGINYRMSPDNIDCITTAGIDCCGLANNHVLDWGYAGLLETLETLTGAGLNYAGAGRTIAEARAPAVIHVADQPEVAIFAYGSQSSGIPSSWAAAANRPGVNLLPDLSQSTVGDIAKDVLKTKEQPRIAVVSIHWGGNWGYEIPSQQIEFAHALIDAAGVDIVHGHSSHHVKAVEVYKGKPVIYGCGDFINDYEGIKGYEEFRGDLSLMYFAQVDPKDGTLAALMMTPTQTAKFRVNRASEKDAQWLKHVLNREGRRFGTQVEVNPDTSFSLRW